MCSTPPLQHMEYTDRMCCYCVASDGAALEKFSESTAEFSYTMLELLQSMFELSKFVKRNGNSSKISVSSKCFFLLKRELYDTFFRNFKLRICCTLALNLILHFPPQVSNPTASLLRFTPGHGVIRPPSGSDGAASGAAGAGVGVDGTAHGGGRHVIQRNLQKMSSQG